MSTRNLYALLVGINDYDTPVGKLTGPVNDVNKWESYLQKEEKNFEVHITTLKDQEATKSGITENLISILDKATAKDVVFFFYAGHGTRESADPVFHKIEQDKALEALVCFDGITLDKNDDYQYNLLADKEIHYIIHNEAKKGTHVLVIMDSCHSGGITRNVFKPSGSGPVSRKFVPSDSRQAFIAPARKWNDFIFGSKISKKVIDEKGWFQSFPQRPHIAISACQNDEVAYEINGNGIFTINAVEVLERSGGAISYHDLQGRVRNFVRNQFDQTPSVYSTRENAEDLLKVFLDKTTAKKSFHSNCFFKKDTGWVVDIGAVNGMSTYAGPISINIDKKNIDLEIRSVSGSYSVLDVPKEIFSKMDKKINYPGEVKNFVNGNTSFFIDHAKNKKDADKISTKIDNFLSNNKAPFSRAEDIYSASYLIDAAPQIYSICYPNQETYLPAVQVHRSDPNSLDRLVQYMGHISRWEYIKSYQNPDFNLSNGYPVDMEFFRINGSQENKIQPQREIVQLEYSKNQANEYGGEIKIKVTNKSQTKYYCAVLYLSNQFQVYGDMLDGKVIPINPGESAWVYAGESLELTLEEFVREYNFPSSISHIKLIANMKPFDIQAMEQDALPAPSKTHEKDVASTTRGLAKRKKKLKPILWFTKLVTLKIKNPFYQES